MWLRKQRLRELAELLHSQWGIDVDLTDKHIWQSAKAKLYLTTGSVAALLKARWRVVGFGLYIGELKTGKLRLSIEGSQLLGPLAVQNVIELNREEAAAWLAGKDIQKSARGYVLLRYDRHWLGCGAGKGEEIANLFPKSRRLVLG